MKEPNFLAGNESLSMLTAIEAVIKRSCIIDYGIVQDSRAKGIVDVAVAVADTPQNIQLITCVLANIASSSITVDVKPNKGDRVLVVYPRVYDDTMFAIPDGDKKAEIIVNEQAKGYNMLGGIAILLNQYKKSSHNNIISFEDGKLDIKLAYDSSTQKNKLNLSSDADGAITLSNDKYEAKIDADGYLSYKNKTDSKTTLEFTSTGSTMQDANGCKIVTDSNGTTINGNLTIKKSGV